MQDKARPIATDRYSGFLTQASGRLIFAFSVLIALVVGLVLYTNYRSSLSALEKDFRKEADIYADTFNVLQQSTQNDLLLVSSTIASDREVQNLFWYGRVAVEQEGGGAGQARARQLRQLLRDLVAPRWAFAAKSLQAQQMHFLLAPGATSFLRINDADGFGDDLSDIRHSVVDVNTHAKPVAGFEIGRTAAGLRGVVPVFATIDDEQGSIQVGALEIAMSFDAIIETLKQTTGSDVTVLLDRSNIDDIMWPVGLDTLSNKGEAAGYFIEATSRPLPRSIIDYLANDQSGHTAENTVAQFISGGENHYVATLLPLRDYQGLKQQDIPPVGQVVIWQDVSERMRSFEQDQQQTLWLGFIAYLIIEGMMIYGLRRVTQGLRREVQFNAEALSRSYTQRQFFEQILDSVEECVFLINEQGSFEYVNRAVVERLGYDVRELLSMSVAQVDADFDFALWPQHWHDLKQAGNMMFESRHRDSSGETFPVEINANFISYQGRDYNLALVRDLSVRKQYEQELQDSSERYQSIISTSRDGFLMADGKGQVIEVNESYCRLTGYTRDELQGRNIADLEANEDHNDVGSHIRQVIEQGGDIFESAHWHKDGHKLPLEVSVSYSPREGGRFFSFLRDIHERKHHEQLSRLRDNLSSLAHQGNVEEVLRKALDVAEALTHSEIAFYHFVDPGEQAISLQTWSTRTLNEMCTTSGGEMHYPVSQAGVWVDCIHQRKAVIYNDYPALTHRKGLPEGHAPLQSFVSVPVFRGDQIVAIIGVGNKKTGYDDDDVKLLTAVADMTYDFAQHSETKQHVEYMAYYDVLTGLPNRELLFERLQQNIAQHARSGRLLALCYLDLDGFKPINDEYGHNIGDQLLIRLGKRLQSAMREGDTIARIGGDEFVILLTGLDSASEAESIVKRLIDETSEPFDLGGKRLYVSASVGITIYPTDDTNPDTLLRHADQAMYTAKELGKSRYKLYEVIEAENQRSQREIQQEVHQALTNNEFTLYYQPRIDLSSGRVVGAEALIRWRHPSRGMLPPAAFLPHVEGTPDEIALGEWVVKQALAQQAAWMDAGIDLPVSINISPEHIQKSGFAEFLRAALANYPAQLAQRVELEILETSAIGDIEKVAAVMRECTQTGVSFSLDDFGTGYSSLTYFHQLPISVLKIDQNFVRHMLERVGDLEIVKGVIHLAQTLSRPVVAEGVENIELGLMLSDMGCQYAQGYGIAKPMPAAKVGPWIEKWAGKGEWVELSSAASAMPFDLELKVALFSLRRWQSGVMKYLSTSGASEKPQVDDKQSQFDRWYQGVGRARYGNHALYSFIPPRHRLVNKLARDLVVYVDNGDVAAALSLVDVFDNACSDLVDKLSALDSVQG